MASKLRAPLPPNPFHIVLVEPEIPPNTGNIARLCAATGSALHLVGRLGFRVDQKAVRRAGLDYWHLVKVFRHDDLACFRQAFPSTRLRFFSANTGTSYLDADIRAGDALVFGRESVGLPDELIQAHPESSYAIPTLGPVRSLNLSNAVSIVVYEGLRRNGSLDTTFMG